MSKSREHVTTNGRAAFYACMWEDFRNAAMDCGWALALHGSLNSDMDIMAMPWVADAKPVEEMIQALLDLFGKENIWYEKNSKPFTDKPNHRNTYTITIWADLHLDISVINVQGAINKALNTMLPTDETNGLPNI